MRPRNLLALWTLACGGLLTIALIGGGMEQIVLSEEGIASLLETDPTADVSELQAELTEVMESAQVQVLLTVAFAVWAGGIVLALAGKGLQSILQEGKHSQSDQQSD